MAIRKVTQAGHPTLKTKNKIVSLIKTKSLKSLIKDLKDTMYKTGLIGIAAPQIAKNYQIFITHPRTTKARKLGKEDNCRVYINPRIKYYSKAKSIIYEGCGSVAKGVLFGPVERPKELIIEAQDENGIKFSLRCDGILARVIQHEMDHLAGIEFIQKIKNYNLILDQEHYRKKIRTSNAQLKACKTTIIKYKQISKE